MTQSASFGLLPRGGYTFESNKPDSSMSEPSPSVPPPTAPPSTRVNAVNQSTSLTVQPYASACTYKEVDGSYPNSTHAGQSRTGTSTAHRANSLLEPSHSCPSESAIDSDEEDDSPQALPRAHFRSKLAASVADSIFRFQGRVNDQLLEVSPFFSRPVANVTNPVSSPVKTDPKSSQKEGDATVPVESLIKAVSKLSADATVPVRSHSETASKLMPKNAHVANTAKVRDAIELPATHQWHSAGVLVTQGPGTPCKAAHTGYTAEAPDIAEKRGSTQWSCSDALLTQYSSTLLKNAHAEERVEVPDDAEKQPQHCDFSDALIVPESHAVPDTFRPAANVTPIRPLAPPPQKQRHPLPSTPFAHPPTRRELPASSTTFSVPHFSSSSPPSSSHGNPVQRLFKDTLHKFLPPTSQQRTTPKGFKQLDWDTSTPDRPVYALGDGFSDVEALPTRLVQVPRKRKFRQPTARPPLGPLELTHESIKASQPWRKAKTPSQPQPKRTKFSKADGSRRKQDLPDDDPFSPAPLPMTFGVTKRMPKGKRDEHEIDQPSVAPWTPTPRDAESVPAGAESYIDPCSPVSLPMTPRHAKRQVKKRDAEHETQSFSPTPSQNRSDDREVNFDPFVSSPLAMPRAMKPVPRDRVIPQSPDRRGNTVSPELGESDGPDGARGTQLGEDPMEGDTLVPEMQLEGGREPYELLSQTAVVMETQYDSRL
ncbi:hypothetical protein GE09DRAFT_483477 [Coniochaeta sp. 2T2.1]|nr:hypothetical protein GE09DRAFT_483477 [Coniochaeta sp. 2T2.1]